GAIVVPLVSAVGEVGVAVASLQVLKAVHPTGREPLEEPDELAEPPVAGADVQRGAVSARERSDGLMMRGEESHHQFLRHQPPAGVRDLGEVEAPLPETQGHGQAYHLGQVPKSSSTTG